MNFRPCHAWEVANQNGCGGRKQSIASIACRKASKQSPVGATAKEGCYVVLRKQDWCLEEVVEDVPSARLVKFPTVSLQAASIGEGFGQWSESDMEWHPVLENSGFP